MINLDINEKKFCIISIAELIENGKIDFDHSVPANAKLFEYIIHKIPMKEPILKYNLDKDSELLFKVYTNNALFNTIYKYIVNDEPLENMTMFEEFNGKRFSELEPRYRRRINETMITLHIDESFYKDDSLLLDYLHTINEYD